MSARIAETGSPRSGAEAGSAARTSPGVTWERTGNDSIRDQ